MGVGLSTHTDKARTENGGPKLQFWKANGWENSNDGKMAPQRSAVTLANGAIEKRTQTRAQTGTRNTKKQETQKLTAGS